MAVADPPETDRLSIRLGADRAETARLSIRLRTATRADHDAAQGSGFLAALAAGRLPRNAYADLTAKHWLIY